MEQKVNFSTSPDVRLIVQFLISYVDNKNLDVEKDLNYYYMRDSYIDYIPEGYGEKGNLSTKINGLKKEKEFLDKVKFRLIDGEYNTQNISPNFAPTEDEISINYITDIPQNISPNFVTTEDGTSYFYIRTSLKLNKKNHEEFLREMEDFFVYLYVRLIKICDPNKSNFYILGFQGKIINNMWVVNRETS